MKDKRVQVKAGSHLGMDYYIYKDSLNINVDVNSFVLEIPVENHVLIKSLAMENFLYENKEEARIVENEIVDMLSNYAYFMINEYILHSVCYSEFRAEVRMALDRADIPEDFAKKLEDEMAKMDMEYYEKLVSKKGD